MALKPPAFNDVRTYGFEHLRYLAETAHLQEGVVGAGDLKVTAAAGGGMKVDVAGGAGYVKGDSGTPGLGLSHGLFLAVNDGSIANAATLATSDPTNPRIDQICLRVRDSSDLTPGGGSDDATIVVVTGTPTSGATLDNRNGAGALPSDHLRLADVLVAAGSSAVSGGNVRDRRPWARGALSTTLRTAADYTVTSGATVLVDATNLNPRIECSGVPVRVTLEGWATHSTAGTTAAFVPMIDGVDLSFGPIAIAFNTSGYGYNISASWVFTPSAGSRRIGLGVNTAAGTLTIKANGTNGHGLRWTVEELVRQDAHNG